jgi:hypothetical protein
MQRCLSHEIVTRAVSIYSQVDTWETGSVLYQLSKWKKRRNGVGRITYSKQQLQLTYSKRTKEKATEYRLCIKGNVA